MMRDFIGSFNSKPLLVALGLAGVVSGVHATILDLTPDFYADPRGYKDINLLAFKLLNPGGLLATYSCSGGISAELFQKIIAGAALDAGVDAQIVHHLHESADHPVLLSFPEGAYLKGLVLRVAA